MRSLGLTLILLALSPDVRAEMDPSTALLLRRPSAAPSLDTLDEEHYTVRPARRAARPSPAPAIIISPEPLPTPAPSAQVSPKPSPRAPAAADDEPHFDDDALMVRVAAGYLNLDADSSNPYRDYRGRGATLGLGITLWATPTFGIKADYLSSVAAGTRRAGVNYGLDHQEIDAALAYRRAWTKTFVDLTVGYHEVSNRVGRASAAPLGTRSRGPDLGVSLTLPSSVTYAHFAELHLQPLLSHAELGPRDGVTSGTTNTSYGSSLAIGGQYAVEHDRDWFWRLRYAFEQNAFARGSTVTTGQATLILGVQWGT